MTRTISKHQFDVDDDQFYTCRHCGRVSKDPSIIRELRCIEREISESSEARLSLSFNDVINCR